jgi:hypothetical protein
MANVFILQNLIKLPNMNAREDLQRLPKVLCNTLTCILQAVAEAPHIIRKPYGA